MSAVFFFTDNWFSIVMQFLLLFLFTGVRAVPAAIAIPVTTETIEAPQDDNW